MLCSPFFALMDPAAPIQPSYGQFNATTERFISETTSLVLDISFTRRNQ
jgi:hypothetical protein